MEVLQRTANRGSISTDTGYDIDNSVKLQTAGVNSEFFERSFSSSSNRQTWTYSTWLKLSQNGVNNYFFDAWKNSNTFFILGVSDAGRLVFYDIVAGTDYGRQTDRLLRDTSAWYHVVFVSDTTNGTAADRYRLYVNGVRETSFSTSYGDPPQNYNGSVNDAIKHRIGYRTDGDTSFNGYLAETILVDGTALDPDSFGEVDAASGIWKPIDVTGLSVGTNGVLMKYENAASMGAATSGTGFSVQNINQNDQATDTPTNNFCLLNGPQQVQSRFTFSQGNTTVNLTGDHNYRTIAGSMGFQHGKWYAEFKMGTGRVQTIVGMTQLDDTRSWQDTYIGGVSNSTAYGMGHSYDGYFYRNGGSGAIGVSWTAGDIIGIAIRINDDGTGFMGMSKNGTWMNSQDPSSGTTGMLGLAYGGALPSHLHHSFAVTLRHDDGPVYANFGGFSGFTISSGNTDANGYGNFEYEVPTGYYALCSKNLGELGG